jgi:hypothetical protein
MRQGAGTAGVLTATKNSREAADKQGWTYKVALHQGQKLKTNPVSLLYLAKI